MACQPLMGYLILLSGAYNPSDGTVVGNGHDQTSSNPEQGCLYFHIALIHLGKVWIQLISLQLWVNSREDWAL